MRALPTGFRLVATLLLLGAAPAVAQIQVDLAIKRTLFLAYEPLLVSVTLRNLSGNPLPLTDSQAARWFGFQVETLDGRPIAPHDSSHVNPPIVLQPGEQLRRTVNLTPLFPIAEFGGYRVRASIHSAGHNRFFTSPPLTVEITDGRPVFRKTVGVPGTGVQRHISLLSHRLPSSTQLYIRIEDPERGRVLCTHRLGRLVSNGPPEVELDRNNDIHILQNSAPKEFLYSHIGLDGRVIARKAYTQTSRRPALRINADGSLAVSGARENLPPDTTHPAREHSLSDRPVPLPGSSTDSSPADGRPRNLLSE